MVFMVILVILAFTIIAGVQIPLLVKKKYIKELIAFCIFLFFGFMLMLLLTLGVELPSPNDTIMWLFDLMNWRF